MMIRFILLFTLLIALNPLFSQTGPAGIGNTEGSDGEPELKLWLIPDSLALAEGDDVLTWTDHSGNGYDLSAESGTCPIFKASGLNGHDYLEFSKANNRIVRNPFDMPTSAVAVFMVLKTSDSDEGLLSYNAAGADNEYLFLKSNDHNTYIGGSKKDLNVSYNDNSWKIFAHQWRNTDGRLYLHINGTEKASTHRSGYTITENGSLAIAGEQDDVDGGYDAGQAFYGDIAEIIMYGSSLLQADRVVIENYLAQKYGLDANLTVDRFDPPDASYIVDMTGVGKEADGVNELNSAGFVVTENGNFDNGDYIFAAHDGTVNSIDDSPNAAAGIEATWSRNWYLDKSGTAMDAKIAFDFSDGIDGDYPSNVTNYRLLYKENPGDQYEVVTTATTGVQNGDQVYFAVTDGNFSNGYFTLGTTNETDSPLDGLPARTWYTLISGDWDHWETWTLDPSGALPNNPDEETPMDDPIDRVVILSGRSITANHNNLQNAYLKIDGELNLQAHTGHSFNEIEGSGRLVLAADNFPSGDATHFTSAGQGEGTVVYEGTSYTLSQSLSFYNLNIELDNVTDKLTLMADYDIAGDFMVDTGEFQINDNSSTTNLNIELLGDASISTAGKILTGTGNARHQFDFYGDLTNNGILEFTNRDVADPSSEAADGIVDANFLNDAKNQTILCDSTSNFYRIEIDKGTDKTYELKILADTLVSFNLYGYASQSHNEVAQLEDNDNALGLVRGTVRLGNNVEVAQLNRGSGNYNISEAARLWIDGGSAAKIDGTAIVPYGEILVTRGTLESTVSSGITTRGNGLVKVEGGTLSINQLRTSIYGDENQGGYVQTGGTTNILGGSTATGYYCFNLTYTGNVFSMSGGTLHIHEAHGKGGIFINSNAPNQNVTGGTVIMDTEDGNDFPITSKAPFWNVIIRNSDGGTTEHILSDGVDVGPSGDPVSLDAQPLVVLNDLTIEANAFLNHDGNDVTIGGDFSIHEDAAQQSGGANNYGYLYDAYKPNTTTFNGNDDATFYIGYPDEEISDNNDWELYMNRLVLNKPAGDTLYIDSDEENNVYNVSADWKARILKLDSIKVESGILDQTDYAIRLTGSVINYDQIGVYEEGVNDEGALIMFAWAEYNVETSDNAIFGNVKLHVGDDQKISFSSDVHIQRLSFRNGRIYAGIHNLTIDNLAQELDPLDNRARFDWDQDGSIQNDERGVYGPNDMIIFDGNVSDGGLSLKITGNGTYTFPIGLGLDATQYLHNTSKYTPAEVTISNFSDDGYITITPVDAELQTTDLSGGDILSYYWNVDYEGFTTKPTVEYNFYYYEDDLDGSTNENSFVPGKVLDGGAYTRSYENDNTQVSDAGTFNASGVLVKNPGTNGILNEILFNDHDNGGNGFTLENANYTAGEANRFVGQPTIYYSHKNSGWGGYDWDNNTSWYDAPTGTNNPSDYPTAGDIAVIRGNNGQDAINVSGTQEAAEVVFEREGTYSGIEDVPRLRFAPGDQLTAGKISGVGHLYFQQNLSLSSIINADIGEFAANDTSMVEFYMTQDGTYDVDEADFFTVLPTLRVYGQNSNYNRTATFNYDMELKNLVVDGEARLLIGGNYTVENRTRLGFTGYGGIQFPDGADAFTFSTGEFVTGNVKNSNADYQLTVADGLSLNPVEHIFEVRENINLDFNDANGDFDLIFHINQTNNSVILKLTGDGDHTFVNGYADANSTIELYKIYMEKGTDQSATFSFDSDFDLLGSTAGTGIDKAITLQNGTLILNHEDIDIDLNTGGDDFVIPSTSALVLNAGKARVNGNSGILLDGSLTIDGGQLDMRGGDNYIEYSASGNAELNIAADTLFVGSQIRRGLTSTEGKLKYNQTGGVAIVGTHEAPENNRGVLEILNGSEFNLTGGKLIISRAQTNPEIASLYLDPAVSNLDENGKIQMGCSATTSNEVIGIYSMIELPHLKVDNCSGQMPTVKQWVVPLTIGDSLVVDAGAGFNADGRDLFIKGDMIVNGTFTPNGNTTTFNGSAQQEITGSPTFYNLTKSNGSILALNNDVTVNNVFSMPSGTLVDNDNTLNIKGNINFGGTHTWGGTSDGIDLNGTSEQIMTGAGTYGLLTIDNAEGVRIEHGSGSGITITKELHLNEGIFDIDQYLLLLQTDAEITTNNSFDANTLIQTNISFTDAGIKKEFPEISSTTDYEFPVGVEGKYTPVKFSIDNVDAGGSIRIKAANEMQPTITDDNDECNEFIDSLNVLQYHWILEADGISGFEANMTMTFDPDDALTEASPSGGVAYDTADYIAARILTYGDNTWNKYNYSNFAGANNQLVFEFTGTDDEGISGDYTAGVEQPGGCNGAIPNKVTEYITRYSNGSWNDETNWARYDSEQDTLGDWGDGVPANGPRGAIIFVAENHTLTIPDNYISAYKTRIEAGATLDVGTTFGHRLGIVTGTGTLYLENGALPAGIYDSLFAPTGGTLHFGGTAIYQMSDISQVNNLRFTGNNWKFFPNNDITILGDLMIDGGYPYQKENRNVYLEGDMVFNSGRFRFGLYKNTFVFSGSADQEITGELMEDPNKSFYALAVNKPNGDLTLNNNVLILDELSLDQGLVNSSSGSRFMLETSTNISNYSDNSYVNGPLKKALIAGSDFTFPIGKDGYYRPIEIVNTEETGDWTAEYSPSNSIMDVNETAIATVSANDEWTVTADYTGSQSAQVTLHWGTETNVSDDTDDYSELLVAYLDGGVWQSAGQSGLDPSATVNKGWVKSADAVTFSDNTFTIASATDDNPLPVSLINFNATVTDNKVKVSWQTLNELNNDYFEVERSQDGVVFETVGRVAGAGNSSSVRNYSLMDANPHYGISYYRLRQVDYDGTETVFPMQVVEITGITLEEPRLNIHPNPYSGGNIIVDIDGFDKTRDAHVILADVSGNSLWSGRIAPTREAMTSTLQPRFEQLKPGFYIVVVVSNDRKISARIVKK